MRLITNIIVMGALALAAVPAVAQAQDLRSPDARDSARQVTRLLGHSSDTPEVAVGPISTLTPQRIAHPAVPVVQDGNGFSWGDAGIGAAGMLGLIAIGAGTFWLAVQRRRDRRLRVATH
jgi:hypothetical protein